MSEDNKNQNENAAKKQGGNRNRRPMRRGHYRNHKHPKDQLEVAPLENEMPKAETTQEAAEPATPDIQEEIITEEMQDVSAEEAVNEEPAAENAPDAPTPMTEVIGVRFRTSGKIYYFDNCNVEYPTGCHAIVDTARGMEYGEVAMSNRMVPTSELVLPLREALRIATPDDDRHHAENKVKEAEAAEIWGKKVAQHGLEMKLIDVECTFDNSKLLFYFTADGRVDFRDLVKDLASIFRCRIELRQMGIRDEAKILGGLGVCGRPFCCHSFLPDFVQVSIKMAKEQNLSLNSAKISGACGRLMCCLRYEYDTYLEESKLTPKVDSLVRTPDGVGTVVESKPLLGLVKVQLANTPDAAPTVYSRELLKIVKPGEPMEPEPIIIPEEPKEKDKPGKTQDRIKPEPTSKRPMPQPRKHQNENSDKKKGADAENKRSDNHLKQDKTERTAPKDKPESSKTEHKYSIQRGSDSAKEENPTPKKRDGNYHRRKNHFSKNYKEKKSGDVS